MFDCINVVTSLMSYLSENVNKSVMENLTFVKPNYGTKVTILDKEMLLQKHFHSDCDILCIRYMDL